MYHVKSAAALVAAAALCVAGLSVAAPATAHGADDRSTTRTAARGDDDREVIRRGGCTGRADWKLKVKTDDGRLEVEGEVDSNRVGQRWRWQLRHDGSLTARGVARTAGRSGSFDVERKVVDLRGADRIVFRAVHAGQVCRGVVNY